MEKYPKLAVIAVSIFIGLLYFFPHALFLRELGENYWGFILLGSPDKEFYLAIVRDVLDGHWLASSPYFFEHKSVGMNPFPMMGVWLHALPGLLFGLEIGTLTMFWDFAAPALATALMYRFCRAAGLSEKHSLAASITAMLAPYILLGQPASLAAYTEIKRTHGFYFFLPMMRSVNPQQSGLFFLAAMGSVSFIKAGEPKYKLAAPLILAFLTGLANPYFTMYLSVFAGIIGISKIAGGYRNDGARYIGVAAAGGAGLALIALNMLILKNKFGSLHTMNLLKTRAPLISPGLIFMIVAASVAYLAGRKNSATRGKRNFVLWLAGAYAIVTNQHLITGHVLQSWHFEEYVAPFIMPVVVFMLVDLLIARYREKTGDLPSRLKVIGNAALSLWIATCTLDGFVEQDFGYSKLHKGYLQASELMAGPFKWLNENAPADSVVMADPINTARFIPVYTPLNVLTSVNATYIPIPTTGEYRDRLMRNLALLGVKAETFAKWTYNNDGLLHHTVFSRRKVDPEKSRGFTSRRLKPIADYEMAILLDDYKSIMYETPMISMPYKVDYMIIGRYETRAYTPPWPVLNNCRTVASGDNWAICRPGL